MTSIESVVEGLAEVAEEGKHYCAGDDVGAPSNETTDGAPCKAAGETAGFNAVLRDWFVELPSVEDGGSAC